jgi:hypothetical protein
MSINRTAMLDRGSCDRIVPHPMTWTVVRPLSSGGSIARSSPRSAEGVVGVCNNIVLKPSVKASDVRDQIRAVSKRNAAIDAGHVSIVADGDKVQGLLLEGGHYRGRQRVDCAGSVTDVVDDLVIA